MAKVLIIYYSQTGNTAKMAEHIAEGIRKEDVDLVMKEVKDVNTSELLEYDGIIMGSPTYYGTMAADIKRLIDDSVKFHGKFSGKIGGAFSSSANIAGGNESTVLDILHAMLIHGMIIQGDFQGDHYGPVAIGAPDNRAVKECVRFGQNTAKLVKRIAG